MVQAFQTIITRNKKPIDTGVISVTMIHTGEATNVIPDSCEIQGTVRTFTTELLDLIETRMKAMAEATCAAFDCSCEFEFHRNYPPTINHPAETAFARGAGRGGGRRERAALRAHDGRRGLQLLPAGEAGLLLHDRQRRRRHREGGHGLGPCMLHNPSYDFNDDLIPLGATAWVRMAEQWLATPR
jgi:metal-dependent amidase/aminoacylase/carboxypeptidase family protein